MKPQVCLKLSKWQLKQCILTPGRSASSRPCPLWPEAVCAAVAFSLLFQLSPPLAFLCFSVIKQWSQAYVIRPSLASFTFYCWLTLLPTPVTALAEEDGSATLLSALHRSHHGGGVGGNHGTFYSSSPRRSIFQWAVSRIILSGTGEHGLFGVTCLLHCMIKWMWWFCPTYQIIAILS